MDHRAKLYLLALACCQYWPVATIFGLTGENVCHRVENFTVTSRERYVEPVVIHTLAWCLQIPPRCPQKRTEMRERWRMKTEVKFKSVPVCCEGYVMQEVVGNASADAKCVPHCKKCRSGVCVAPNQCSCDPGFQGQDCAHECPQGSWGQNCKNQCNCQGELSCNPINGYCLCPAGWTGSRCESKCPEGQWGQSCNSSCQCESPQARCHHETGECPTTTATSGADNGELLIDPYEASGVSVNSVPNAAADEKLLQLGPPILAPDQEYNAEVIDFDKETSSVPRIIDAEESDSATIPSLPDDLLPAVIVQQTTRTIGPADSSSTRIIGTIRTATTTQLNPAATAATTAGANDAAGTEGNQLSRSKKPLDKQQPATPPGERFDFDEQQNNFRVIVSPHKGDSSSAKSSIPIDVAAMIVVGALVSIGLTSVAALMIFHARSRLLKTALSIYGPDKVIDQRQYIEKDATLGSTTTTTASCKNLDVNVATLPRGTLTRTSPIYGTSVDTNAALLTFDDRPPEYANGTVTIGIRLSSNIRDLLESHYDRPASCSGTMRNSTATLPTTGAAATTSLGGGEPLDVAEHVYDEIPLSSPFFFTKDT